MGFRKNRAAVLALVETSSISAGEEMERRATLGQPMPEAEIVRRLVGPFLQSMGKSPLAMVLTPMLTPILNKLDEADAVKVNDIVVDLADKIKRVREYNGQF